uniref:m-AAA protease-interacting protein 1, mitochondrial isoform X2 n=1 Tax=Centroberyx gerrardi TaxID=166262 RepID=UPI003AABE83B
MQRITSLAACRELGGLATRTSRACPGKRSPDSRRPAAHRQRAVWHHVCPVRPFTGEPAAPGRGLCGLRGRRVVFAGQKHRLFSTERGDEPGSSGGHPGISVALVHISNMMSSGRFKELRGIVSNEMVDYVEKKCKSLSDVQRQQLAASMDDIVFLLPEDVSVVFDQYGRKFCFVVMRFWLLSTLEGPDDPEGTKIFKVASSEDGGPQKKIVTAVYEFHRELTRGAPPDWTVTNVWHWPWKMAE